MLFFALLLVAQANAQNATTITAPASTEIIEVSSITSSATLPTPSCNTQNGRNCDRLPEQPYYPYVDPADLTNSFYGFTADYFQDPWFRYEISHPSAPPEAMTSASSCSAIFESSLSEYLTSAPLISVTTVPQSTITTTESDFSATYTLETSTGVGQSTDTYTFSGSTLTTLTTTTFTDVAEYSTTISTLRETAGTDTLTYAGYTAYFYKDTFAFKPTSTCCSACTIFAGTIEVLYWPTPTATPAANLSAASTTVNSAGFTLWVHPLV